MKAGGFSIASELIRAACGEGESEQLALRLKTMTEAWAHKGSVCEAKRHVKILCNCWDGISYIAWYYMI